MKRRPKVSAADVAWGMSDEETLRYAFFVMQSQGHIKQSHMYEVVLNQTDAVLQRILAKIQQG